MDDQGRWQPEDEDEYEAADEELKKRFEVWAAAHRSFVDKSAPEGLLHYKWAYMDGHLTRWRCEDLDRLYLDLYPAKVIMNVDEVDDCLEEAEAFLSFLAASELLDADSDPIEELLEHLVEIGPEFAETIGDPSRFSFGKSIWSGAIAEGVDMSDRAAIERYMAEFNAKPGDERDRILGFKQSVPAGRATPPGTRQQPSRKRRKRR